VNYDKQIIFQQGHDNYYSVIVLFGWLFVTVFIFVL